MDAAPVIHRGHNVAVFVPPVGKAALPVFGAGGRRPLLILTADAARAAELADLLGGFAVSGWERARRRLAGDVPGVVACGVADALALLARSALRPAAFAAVALAWPEQLDGDGEAALAPVLAECDRDAQRLLLTWRAGEATDALIERYAFKAMTFGFPAPGATAAPAPLGAARYVIAPLSQLARLTRLILDAVNPERDDLVVIAGCPASRDDAAALLTRSGGEPPVIIAAPHQLAWLRALFAPLSPLQLAGAAELADGSAERLRGRLARTIEAGGLDAQLLQLGPLLERYDPALLAAAALKLLPAGEPARGSVPPPPAPGESPASSVKIWIGVGRKDGAKPGDLVGAIVNEAGVAADAIGRIEVRDLFCLVDVRADCAGQVVKGLTGRTVRGRRLVARVDRGPGAAARPPRRV